ncbi:phosphocarrier protein HPr/phosphocarrier protein [Paenibacillus phyllosphaerae]|uniref:Phosphocarrier protein HPr/phosphocarrier protein n=1 Tax=Paenibacillus phyllosphaerae TaxID=274593 RepID=A0A7W5AT80_9BACL|nr:HPr family phosphocarrier protein [Paenibacillus phyllosphaerae]MBB3108182.1 phosphocarrier protein HPr/phosphocarrier protein [Paenibacillus phyllosphaerae]
MIKHETTIRNESGFHIRPAQLFTETAARYASNISVTVNGTSTTVDGKSILGLMTLGLSKGAEITITSDGADEAEAIRALIELAESGFGEN